MVVEDSQLVDEGRRFANHGSSRLDVFSILTAAGVGTLTGRHERQGVLAAVASHLLERRGQQRVPVSVAPVDGQSDSGLIDLDTHGGDQFPHLSIDGTDTTKMLVMFGD